MKKLIALLLALLMVFSMAACGAKEQGSNDPVAPEKEETAIKTVYDTSEYASKTEAELYELAKEEAAAGKTLVVYSETSSTEKSVKKFVEKYPELDGHIEVSKMKNAALMEKYVLECESGQAYCDMIVAGDSEGSKYNEWYDKGWVVAYVPEAMKSDLYEEFLTNGLPITIEADIFWYSQTMYPNGSPVNNVWDIFDQDANGNYIYHVYMHDYTNNTALGIYANFIDRADEMAAAYKAKTGKDLEYTYDASELGVEPNNAGWEWLYRYLQCNYTTINDSDEILATIDKATEPSVGIGSSLKLGDTQEAGEHVAFCTGMQPFSGFAKVKYVYIATSTDNPAMARLLTIFSLGGEDGQGEGYDAYVKRNGCYGVRYSHDDSTHSEVPFKDINAPASNIGFVYEKYLDVQDFYKYYQDKFGK